MTAKKHKIQQLVKENKELEDIVIKLNRKIDILLKHGDHRIYEIDKIVDSIEQTFSAQLTWNELSADPNRQLKILKRSIDQIRKVSEED